MRELIDMCMRTNINERPSAMDIVNRIQVTSDRRACKRPPSSQDAQSLHLSVIYEHPQLSGAPWHEPPCARGEGQSL